MPFGPEDQRTALEAIERQGNKMPQRIQRRRVKGWRMPAGAVYVGRGSRFGNPFRLGQPNADDCMICADAAEAVAKYQSELTTFADRNFIGVSLEDIRRELSGRDLACWCPLGHPCHADVLLEIANAVRS